ncbi:MAG: outer membrane beta-barrel protein [Psychroflexus sp.]
MVLFVNLTQAQESNFSVELNYPVPVDNNFMGENYKGIIDFGIAYRFIDLNIAKIGVSANAGFYADNDNEETGFDEREVSVFAVQPRAFIEFDLEENSKFRPRIGLGYTSMHFKLNELPPNFIGELEDSETLGGFNLNLGVGFNFSSKFFALIQYDFVKLPNKSGFPDSNYAENVNLLKIGVGFRF